MQEALSSTPPRCAGFQRRGAKIQEWQHLHPTCIHDRWEQTRKLSSHRNPRDIHSSLTQSASVSLSPSRLPRLSNGPCARLRSSQSHAWGENRREAQQRNAARLIPETMCGGGGDSAVPTGCEYGETATGSPSLAAIGLFLFCLQQTFFFFRFYSISNTSFHCRCYIASGWQPTRTTAHTPVRHCLQLFIATGKHSLAHCNNQPQQVVATQFWVILLIQDEQQQQQQQQQQQKQKQKQK